MLMNVNHAYMLHVKLSAYGQQMAQTICNLQYEESFWILHQTLTLSAYLKLKSLLLSLYWSRWFQLFWTSWLDCIHQFRTIDKKKQIPKKLEIRNRILFKNWKREAKFCINQLKRSTYRSVFWSMSAPINVNNSDLNRFDVLIIDGKLLDLKSRQLSSYLWMGVILIFNGQMLYSCEARVIVNTVI